MASMKLLSALIACCVDAMKAGLTLEEIGTTIARLLNDYRWFLSQAERIKR